MSLRSSIPAVVRAAALALLVGCATTPQQPPADGTPPPPPTTEPTPGSPQPPPSSDASPWQRARMGDRVVYAFSANRKPGPGASEARIAGTLALEVVAAQFPWVWLKLSFTDEAGQALANPMLAKQLVLPMRTDATRPLDVPREGAKSAEQLSAAGRTWEAIRYIRDNRPADGPLENRLYAVSPGPLYLMNGLLSASTTLSGFGASGGSQLTLTEARQGAEGTPSAAPPSLQYPLGPGTWTDFSVNAGGGEELQRSCMAAERGYGLIVLGRTPAAGGATCPSFAEAEVVPLEEALLTLVGQSLEVTRWPPPAVAPTSRGSFSAQGRSIPALTFETAETVESARQIRYETYAADPWNPALDGLNLAARFGMLAEGADRVEGKGQRKPTFSKKLLGWGFWVEGAK
ncbi:MAG TPA: DUF6068 family protein [Hyalangium sp.]|nr:DUF6068 family protein [Hyalangium sp.]